MIARQCMCGALARAWTMVSSTRNKSVVLANLTGVSDRCQHKLDARRTMPRFHGFEQPQRNTLAQHLLIIYGHLPSARAPVSQLPLWMYGVAALPPSMGPGCGCTASASSHTLPVCAACERASPRPPPERNRSHTCQRVRPLRARRRGPVRGHLRCSKWTGAKHQFRSHRWGNTAQEDQTREED
jgi:hypothetical protein